MDTLRSGPALPKVLEHEHFAIQQHVNNDLRKIPCEKQGHCFKILCLDYWLSQSELGSDGQKRIKYQN